jgi:hypothetical protein
VRAVCGDSHNFGRGILGRGKIDEGLCAKSLAEILFLVTAVDGDHTRAHCFGVLHGKVTRLPAAPGNTIHWPGLTALRLHAVYAVTRYGD